MYFNVHVHWTVCRRFRQKTTLVMHKLLSNDRGSFLFSLSFSFFLSSHFLLASKFPLKTYQLKRIPLKRRHKNSISLCEKNVVWVYQWISNKYLLWFVYIWFWIVFGHINKWERNVEREEKNHSFETKSQRKMTTIHEQTKWSTDVEEFFPNSLDSVSFTVCIASFYFSIWPRRWSGRKSNVIKRNNNNNKIKTSSYLFVDSHCIVVLF